MRQAVPDGTSGDQRPPYRSGPRRNLKDKRGEGDSARDPVGAAHMHDPGTGACEPTPAPLGLTSCLPVFHPVSVLRSTAKGQSSGSEQRECKLGLSEILGISAELIPRATGRDGCQRELFSPLLLPSKPSGEGLLVSAGF